MWTYLKTDLWWLGLICVGLETPLKLQQGHIFHIKNVLPSANRHFFDSLVYRAIKKSAQRQNNAVMSALYTNVLQMVKFCANEYQTQMSWHNWVSIMSQEIPTNRIGLHGFIILRRDHCVYYLFIRLSLLSLSCSSVPIRYYMVGLYFSHLLSLCPHVQAVP
jgi:hypothetical protein